MKKLVPAYVLSFVICFMLFIYEPLLMYASNINDFWFDIYTLMVAMLPAFLVLFAVSSFIFTCIYYFNKKFLVKRPIFEIVFIISMIMFLVTYIQGNYLSGNLPVLNGEEINWSSYTTENIIYIVVFIVIIGLFIFLVKKYKYEKTLKISMYVSLAIFVMLTLSLVPYLLNGETYVNKPSFDVTMKNANVASSDKNFYIFLVDTVDSTDFTNVIKDTEYSDMFNDFTYYADALSAYPFTRDSIPFILSGKWNENEQNFLKYYEEAVNSSALFERLENEEYDINIYEDEIISFIEKKWNIDNFEKSSDNDKSSCLIKKEVRYDMFKYLPYFAKKYAEVDNINFSACRLESEKEIFLWWDLDAYYNLLRNGIEKTDNKMFKFIHLEGAHGPFDLDENLEYLDDNSGTYYQKLLATAKIIETYLNRLKENDAYDNSVIIILSDHGYDIEGATIEGRMNPILYIKGIDEHHKMITSNKKVSFGDLMSAYMDLLDGKKSTELFKDIGTERTRRFLWYVWSEEDHMIEYELTGKANDVGKMTKTGREFNR